MKSKKSIEEYWESFKNKCMSGWGEEESIDVMRMAFFAGAFALWSLIIGGFSKLGSEATKEDMAMMDGVHAELRAFLKEMCAYRDGMSKFLH